MYRKETCDILRRTVNSPGSYSTHYSLFKNHTYKKNTFVWKNQLTVEDLFRSFFNLEKSVMIRHPGELWKFNIR